MATSSNTLGTQPPPFDGKGFLTWRKLMRIHSSCRAVYGHRLTRAIVMEANTEEGSEVLWKWLEKKFNLKQEADIMKLYNGALFRWDDPNRDTL
ncbi:hypothetical protein R1sor_025782 [Riccia sorocarpa]|uniref:Uncharacterized protein n=1 Tax=Riccia sorocarpa TaxID=122646 RepID=A0ABD3GDH7_9MARC